MKKYTISLVLLIAFVTSAFGMVGGPTFLVPMKATSMSVCGSQFNSLLKSEGSSGEQPLSSNRVTLMCRYGLLSNLDVGGEIGTANLNISELGSGYSDFDADWSLSWGANARVGFPGGSEPLQVTGGVGYFGFSPSGATQNSTKSISSKYTWHEVTPSLTAGYRVSNMIPYVGLSKPFLFGEKDTKVSFNGDEFPAAGGRIDYSDSEQSVRGHLGLEWKLPDGYSVTGEAGSSMDGDWTLSIGLTQIMR